MNSEDTLFADRQTTLDTVQPTKANTKNLYKGDKKIAFGIGIPAIIWQALFFYLPLLLMLFSSFTAIDTTGSSVYFSLKNFYPLMSMTYFKVILSSLLLATTTTVICLFIAYPLAHFIAFKTKKLKPLFLFLLIIPFWTNFLLHIYAWFFMLEKQGFINHLLISIGLIREPLHILNTHAAVLIMMVYYFLTFMVLPIYAALERFDVRLIEASKDLGASPIKSFIHVLLPLTLPAIRTGVLLVFIPAFGEFLIPELMSGDKEFYVGNVIALFSMGAHTIRVGMAFTMMSVAALGLALLSILGIFKLFEHTLRRGAIWHV